MVLIVMPQLYGGFLPDIFAGWLGGNLPRRYFNWWWFQVFLCRKNPYCNNSMNWTANPLNQSTGSHLGRFSLFFPIFSNWMSCSGGSFLDSPCVSQQDSYCSFALLCYSLSAPSWHIPRSSWICCFTGVFLYCSSGLLLEINESFHGGSRLPDGSSPAYYKFWGGRSRCSDKLASFYAHSSREVFTTESFSNFARKTPSPGWTRLTTSPSLHLFA